MSTTRKRATMKALVFGCASAALYALVFQYQQPIMDSFTAGGINAILPVATVFAFSYVHGTFASNVWTALGIDAAKKKVKTVRPVAEPVRPRARA